MKELFSVAANFCATWSGDKTHQRHQVEVLLILSEPVYDADLDGNLIKSRQHTQCRFSASPAQLRSLADSLTELAEEAEALPLAEKKASSPA